MNQKIRMTLLIDERSHPELYADLQGIEGDRNRTERVRYLAGIGLVLSRANSAPQPMRVSTQQVVVPTEVSALPVVSETPVLSTPKTRAPENGEGTRGVGSEQETSSQNQQLAVLPVPNDAIAVAESPAARAAKQMAKAGLFGLPSSSKQNDPQ